jgi:hypothetical protein
MFHGASRKHFGKRAEGLDFEKLVIREGLEGATEVGIWALLGAICAACPDLLVQAVKTWFYCRHALL